MKNKKGIENMKSFWNKHAEDILCWGCCLLLALLGMAAYFWLFRR